MEVQRKDSNYVDDQKITLPENKCFSPNGTMSYMANNNIRKTVRKIKILEEAPVKDKNSKK